MPLRKEFLRGLIALAALVALGAIGLATFAALAPSEGFRTRAKDAIATRLKHAR